MTEADLVSLIEEFASRHGIAPATLTSRAVGNSRLFELLKSGKSCTLSTAHRLVEYIDSYEEPPNEDAA